MNTTNTTPTKLLAMPIPDGCSDLYAAGWASADLHIRLGGSLDADAPAEWHEEKAVGFWDRLSAERSALAAVATEKGA